MPRSHDVLRDEDAVRLLATMIRARPQLRSDLDRLGGLPGDRLDEVLGALVEAGFVHLDDDTVALRAPEEVLADQADALGAAASLLSRVSRQREREDPTTPAKELAVEVVRGRQAQWRAWERYVVDAPPRAPLTIYPSATLVRDAVPSPGPRSRAVLPASCLLDDGDREVVERLVQARVEVRFADDVDSWVYVDPGVLAAVPLSWGEALPSSMMFVRDEALLAALAAYAELVWAAARPHEQATASWAPVLEMMARGRTDPEIARSLRVSVRAVQRLIAESMAHYDVASRFELGAAWAGRVTDPS